MTNNRINFFENPTDIRQPNNLDSLDTILKGGGQSI
jgi:hypothetical protein